MVTDKKAVTMTDRWQNVVTNIKRIDKNMVVWTNKRLSQGLKNDINVIMITEG